MPVIKPLRNIIDKNTGEILNVPAVRISKKLGAGAGYGFADLGKAEFGDNRWWAGTYQKRVTGYNNRGRNPKRARKTYIVRMADCTPGNPRTYKQQLGRRIITTWWQGLTKEQKAYYNKLGTGTPRNGYNIFTSEQLKRSVDFGRTGRQTYGVAKYGGEIIFEPQKKEKMQWQK